MSVTSATDHGRSGGRCVDQTLKSGLRQRDHRVTEKQIEIYKGGERET